MYIFKFYLLFFSILGYVLVFSQGSGLLRYSQIACIPFDWDMQGVDTIYFIDSLSDDVLYQVKARKGIPLYYAHEISKEVCTDRKCRPLYATIYWNITGRYLGFSLPETEYLSKYNHSPFVEQDYELLNALLADPHLPLAKVSFQDLMQPVDVNSNEIDAVSGATSKVVSSYVVEGAAYSTYALWNIVYGRMQTKVAWITEQEMEPGLLANILESPSSEDRIWAMERINGSKMLGPEVEQGLLNLIGSDDFFVAYSAINILSPIHLQSESLQINLFTKYQEINYNLRKSILAKLSEANSISRDVIIGSRNILPNINGTQLEYWLELYNKHGIDDLDIQQTIARLLEKENRFVTEKAYRFLINKSIMDEEVLRALEKYERQR